MNMKKVLLDTDIGSDIDDAVCLAYLLAQPECELLGITTVTGQAGNRAALASALCQVAGRDIPIFPGAEKPLLVAQQQPQAPQAEALPRWPHRDFLAGEAAAAIDFLRQTIRAHPGQVNLLTIGPLTNAGLLFALDPEIPALLQSLTLMCGHFSPGAGREWNAMGDPHATAIVYQAAVPTHRSVGLDVTMQVRLPADQVRARFTPRLLRPVLDFAEIWFREQHTITFHDPLAATTLFDERICTFEPGNVSVELSDPEALGQTRWQAGGTPARHAVALQVDAARFFEHYFSVFAA
jgi:purine nucleosidase